MKHLFYVHSNITLLSCMAVIEKNDLKNILILFGRSYTNSYINLDYKVLQLPKLIIQLDQIPTSGIFKPFWIAQRLSSLDKILQQENNETFCCYLPHTNNFLMQAIITHPSCIEFNIIDEGLLNYSAPNYFIKQTNPLYSQQFFLKRRVKYFSYFNRSIVFKSIKAELNTIYLFKQSDFSNLNYLFSQINYPDLNLELISMDNKHVFVFDNAIQENLIEEKDFYILILKIFNNFKDLDLYIKFHPAQINVDRIITQLSTLNLRFSIIPNDIPLELVFVKSKNMTIYGIWSSLLFYATVSNHLVISYAGTAGIISKKAKEWTESYMPKIFYKNIQLR